MQILGLGNNQKKFQFQARIVPDNNGSFMVIGKNVPATPHDKKADSFLAHTFKLGRPKGQDGQRDIIA